MLRTLFILPLAIVLLAGCETMPTGGSQTYNDDFDYNDPVPRQIKSGYP